MVGDEGKQPAAAAKPTALLEKYTQRPDWKTKKREQPTNSRRSRTFRGASAPHFGPIRVTEAARVTLGALPCACRNPPPFVIAHTNAASTSEKMRSPILFGYVR